LNIELLTGTELLGVDGDPGRFTARIRKHPRYVELDKCTSCGECAKVCPISLDDSYNEGLSQRQAVYKQYPQAIPGAFAIEKRGLAPCRGACPAQVSAQGFIALINGGRYREALELFKRDNPFPGICGRVCHHPCEGRCTRDEVDAPLAIRGLHRFLADTDAAADEPFVPARGDARDERVAIIGAGPAGLACAYFLAVSGYRVTVYEKLPRPGGMLVAGIPRYRLPRGVIDDELQVLERLGVEIKTGVEVGTDITFDGLRAEGVQAIFVAVGAHVSKRLRVEGEDLAGVHGGVEYLRQVNLGEPVALGDRVAVIGGGNVAMDAVRTALRLGSKEAMVVYRRTEAQMPADADEITECRDEGIEIMTLVAPVRILGQGGRVKALECIRMELGEPDDSGRRRPVPIEGSELTLEVDAVIPAIGQETDWRCLPAQARCQPDRWGRLEVDPVTRQTTEPDVFAGGDAVTGPATVVEAIGAGKEAAISIDRFLRGDDLREGRESPKEEVGDVDLADRERRPRVTMAHRDAAERVRDFAEVQLGYDEAQTRREAERCLACAVCAECYRCVDVCLAGAVDHDQEVVESDLDVGAVVLCPGSRPYDPTPDGELYLYGRHPDVVTSLELERLLSASGPTQGHLVRPSNQQEPTRIAWLQCVGSRDANRCGNGYCSSVCCMVAVKDSMIAKEHAAGPLDCAIFNMDVRTFGKDYEKYYQRARERGVRFVKARVHSIYEEGDARDLAVRYVSEKGEVKNETFDMVVLSVGLEVTRSTVDLAGRLGIELDEHKFAVTRPFNPVETTRPGIYACGVFQEAKDIPSAVTEGSAAACAAASRLAAARNTLTKRVDLPAERDVSGEPPRVGVFVCNCGINIASVVDVEAVASFARDLPGVAYVGSNLFTCSQDSQQGMKELIVEHDLNRVVVAACTPKTHESIFMDTLREVGLNRYLFEMANIRNQNAWVHSSDPVAATAKAKDLVTMAVARAASLKPLVQKRIPVTPRALVVGGGVAGMNAAIGLADQGFEVYLVEKEAHLGGLAHRLTATIEGDMVAPYLADLVSEVESHAQIQVLTQSLIVGFSGFKGNFTTEVLVGPGPYARKVEHGVVILATGAREYVPTQYGYRNGGGDRIVTQLDLPERLARLEAGEINNVVMIQCVGSRDADHPNCSRVCCQTAVKNAIHIKEDHPDARVVVLYRDMRTYGRSEAHYRRARELGVMFARFAAEDPPRVNTSGGSPVVQYTDHVLDRPVAVEADLLVLSAGMRAADTQELASLVKVAHTAEGHFMEAHVKLRPVDMATDGVFVCGTAHSPKLLSETIAQAEAAAARAATFLSQSELTLSAVTAEVNPNHCASCLICVRTCPYEVPRMNADGKSEIDEALCHGCGVCAAECPGKAIHLNLYEDDQILCKVEALLEDAL